MESTRRSIAKAVTWRLWATTETMMVTWFVTGDLKIAGKVGMIEFVLKLCTFFIHERIWNKVKYGRPQPTKDDFDI